MNLKLIHYSISLILQKTDSQTSNYSLQWKLDNDTFNIPLNENACNQPFCTQSNFILDQQKILEDKITTISFLADSKVLREHKINLSKYLNSKLKEVYDILNINEDTQLHITWKFQKLYGIDLGNQQKEQSPPPKNRKSEVVQKKSVTINSQSTIKNNESPTKKANEECGFSMIKLVAENKKLKAQVIELKRQIESLQQQKPVYISAEVEGFLRDYQMENEKIRKMMREHYEQNLLLQSELRKVHSLYQQNTQRFQAFILQLQNRFEEVLIGCQNYTITLDNFQQQSLANQQKINEIDEQEIQRKLELSRLFKGKVFHSTSDLQQSNTNSNHTSQLDYKGQEFCQLLDKD